MRNKGLVFMGPDASGKTRKAREIASKYNSHEVVWIQGNRKYLIDDNFLFSDCTMDTKLIVIDDIIHPEVMEFFFYLIPDRGRKLLVNPKGCRKFEIDLPDLIITCNSRIQKPRGASFLGRYDIVEFPINADTEIQFSPCID